MTTSDLFHVVCRECRTESLVGERNDAERIVADHTSAAGHRMALARID